MFKVEYMLIILMIITEVICLVKYLKKNKFEKVDIYTTQFLIAGCVLLILSNLILLLTWNIAKDEIYVTSVSRAIYVLIYCTSIPFISSYIFNHISVSKRVDIIAHCILVLANMIPVAMVVLIPVYLNGKSDVLLSMRELLQSPQVVSDLKNTSFINSYLYLIEYDKQSPYFSTALSLSWLTVLFSYIFVIISMILKKVRIRSQKIEHYYLFLILLLYIGITLNLLSSPHQIYSILIYHIRAALEIVFFLILASMDNSKNSVTGGLHG